MILGIARLTFALCDLLFPLLPILAIIFGHIALGAINRTGAPGRGSALAGWLLGYFGLFFAAAQLVAAIVIRWLQNTDDTSTVSSPTPQWPE